jgi:hypothetical protein
MHFLRSNLFLRQTGVNFINVQTSFWQLFSSYMYVVKAAKTMFVRKICMFNIDEIDTWAQFHQRSTYSFYACRSRMRKKRQSSQQCHLAVLGPTSVKAARKMLVKLTPGGRS